MGGCILWAGHLDRDGYGRSRNKPAHRLAYETAEGPIPTGLTIDHLCRVRACVNPAHLEVVTRRENTMRGVGISAVNARKTECANGHPFDDANTHFAWAKDRQGKKRQRRICRACNALAVSAYKNRKKEQSA